MKHIFVALSLLTSCQALSSDANDSGIKTTYSETDSEQQSTPVKSRPLDGIPTRQVSENDMKKKKQTVAKQQKRCLTEKNCCLVQ